MNALEQFRRWVQWMGSQTMAADAIGCSSSMVSQVCSGTKGVGLETAVAIKAAMKRPNFLNLPCPWPPIEPREWIK